MASNTIKGLTVEIGGDTTKLGKALESVNKKSKDLSSELGEINKLLKMDPGNAELLAQKQKVLAEAVKNTAEKLETLKDAEKQVQKQFERGEVSEEQVRALKREIIQTEKKMESYERASEETADEIQKLGKENKDARKDVDKLGDEAKDAGDDLEKAGDQASSFGDKVKAAGSVAVKGFAAVTAVIAGAITALVAAAESSREYRREMGKLDTAFTAADHSSEAATKTYKALQGVLGETDQAVEAANHLAKLTDNEKDLQKWTDICTGVYATFGASLPIEGLTEAANETAKVGKVTGPLADALNWAGVNEDKFNESLAACSDEQERQALIMETLNGLYTGAAEKYKETNAEVIRANQANEEWASTMAEVGGTVEPLLSDVKFLGASLVKDLVPGVKEVTESFRKMLNGDEGAAGDMGAALSGIVSQLLTKITESLPRVAEMGVSLITSLATSIIQSLPQLLSTGWQMVTTVGSGLLQALPEMLSTGGQIVGQLLSGIVGALPSLAQKGLELIGNLVSGLQTNLPLVLAEGARILGQLGEGIRQNLPSLISQALDILMNLATTLYDNAPMLIEIGFDLLSNLVQGILDSLPVLLSKAPEIISKFANIINDNFPKILMMGVKLIWQIITGIIQAIPALIQNAPKIITAIVDVWEAFNWVNLGKKAITFLKDGIKSMIGAVKSAGTNVLNGVTGALKNLPSNLLNIGKNALSNLGGAIRSGANLVKSAATNIVNTIFNTIKSIPSKMLGIGKDVVRGLWNGISDMAGWVIGKIQGFGESVLDGIKDFFGINSPSTVFRDEVGKMLPAGMAIGIEKNADAPLDAMSDLSQSMLDEVGGVDGLAIERRINHTYGADAAALTQNASMLSKLDQILKAIQEGKIIALDGEALVGGTVNRMNNALGQRRVLAERGAV